MNVIVHNIKNIEKELIFNDVYYRDNLRGFVMGVMALNGPMSWKRRIYKLFSVDSLEY